MRFVVYGAGAIGGAMGGLLFRAGHQVTLIARGDHLRALQTDGLILETPGGSECLAVPAVNGPGQVDWGDPAVVVLAVKGQDTDAALDALGGWAPAGTSVVCAQNGVENERRVLRRFGATYAMAVVCAATHLRPGVVQVHFASAPGILDLGRYPGGVDATAEDVAAALRDAGFDSRAVPDIMRWKYRKLVHNLGNAVEALCGPTGRTSRIAHLAREEGEAALAAAGIPVATLEEDRARRGTLLFGEAGVLAPTRSGAWEGGSSWQSVVRGTGTVEADFLNGEVVLLGRLHGVPTPANALLQRRVASLARERGRPGQVSPEELLVELDGGAR